MTDKFFVRTDKSYVFFVNSSLDLYVCVQVLPENTCIVKGVVPLSANSIFMEGNIMAMLPGITGANEIPEQTGGGAIPKLPAGGYVCRILNVGVDSTQNGSTFIKL